MAGRIAGKDSHLAVVDLADRSALLALYANGVFSFLEKARLIEHEHASGSPISSGTSRDTWRPSGLHSSQWASVMALCMRRGFPPST